MGRMLDISLKLQHFCHVIKYNNGMFLASKRPAKLLNICYAPNAIINCDDGTNETQKH